MKKQWATPINQQTKREGVVLKNIRINAELTMRQLAMLLGISHTAISQVEHGKLALPRYRQEQWVLSCGYTVLDYDRLLGKKFQLINYKDELISMLKNLDQETIELAYKVIKRFSENLDFKNNGAGIPNGESASGEVARIKAL
tara:strand:- start:4112 stop:4540 length:429 start_codon:yes stop_codon:yes gene_type:complete